MRKEIYIAITFGILFGFILSFGIYRANSALKNKNPVNTTPKTETQNPQQGENTTLGISLANLESNDVITESPVNISGITTPTSLVIVSSEDEDFIIKTNEGGSFEQKIKLAGGVNQLLIKSLSPLEEKRALQLDIIYSTEFKEDENITNPTATNSSDVREKVKEKIEAARKSPKAYLGTVTDKTSDSFQIKNILDEIQFISIVPEKVKFVKTGKTSSNIKFEEVAIGDFIVAMGYLTSNGQFSNSNNNKVLEAQRILVTQPISAIDREIIFGEVSKIEKRNVNIKDSNGKELTLEFPKKWKGPEIKEIKVGDKIISVGNLEGNVLKLRTVEVVTF